jgi:transcriptional regulator with XRE-family HTH domain
MTPEQSRMARAALKWSLTDLAEASGVGRATAARFELGQSVEPEKIAAMRKALIASGAEFTRRAGRVGVTIPE